MNNKHFLVLFLVVFAVFALTGCGGSGCDQASIVPTGSYYGELIQGTRGGSADTIILNDVHVDRQGYIKGDLVGTVTPKGEIKATCLAGTRTITGQLNWVTAESRGGPCRWLSAIVAYRPTESSDWLERRTLTLFPKFDPPEK